MNSPGRVSVVSPADTSLYMPTGPPWKLGGPFSVESLSGNVWCKSANQCINYSMTAVVGIRQIGDDDALAMLKAGEVFASAADFGRRCGWNRQKASRRLKEWADAGLLKLEKKHGKTAIVTVQPSCPVPVRVSAPVSAPSGTGRTDVQNDHKNNRLGFGRVMAAVLCCLIGVTMASFLVAVNGTSWAGFVRNAQAWYIMYGFVAMGVTISIAVMILPAVIRLAPSEARLGLRATFWFLFAVELIVQIGFAYGNFGSAVAGTAASANTRAYHEQNIHRLRREQQGMEGKFVPTTKEAAEAATKARERACEAKSFCKAAEAKETTILKDRGITIRAAEIDTELKDAESKRDDIQVVASADPLTDGVIDLVYQTSGHKLEARAVTTGRNVIFALFLLVPAGFFRGAASLARR